MPAHLTYVLTLPLCAFFFFKQKTAYEMRISDWSSDVCSSDLAAAVAAAVHRRLAVPCVGGGLRQHLAQPLHPRLHPPEGLRHRRTEAARLHGGGMVHRPGPGDLAVQDPRPPEIGRAHV